ncbi:pyruvate dehydrogenase (acetyl-transferring), homodimeric type, partial [Acinetobacter baumannii]|nr:pyruvate dehydrogenase (acetyl-transferring), homodimeric type [Acinetobacter baumannii]
MIPLYIFYSMFGFQRTGDQMWQAGDQKCRGFLLGATAGRTTLTGEGLQHMDGHSPLLAATNPAVVTYDPAFAYEAAYIIREGIDRMYGEGRGEDVMYYLTIYNEPTSQPAAPEDLNVEGLLKGIYAFKEDKGENHVNLLASGIGMQAALRAADMLAEEYDIP